MNVANIRTFKFGWFEIWEHFYPDNRVALYANPNKTKFWCIHNTKSLKLTLLLAFILLYFLVDQPL